MDENMTVPDAVRAALFGSGVPNLSPEEAAVRENLLDEGIDTFEIDLQNLPEEMFVSDGEDADDKQDPYVLYYQMQLLDTIRPSEKTAEVSLLFYDFIRLCPILSDFIIKLVNSFQ